MKLSQLSAVRMVYAAAALLISALLLSAALYMSASAAKLRDAETAAAFTVALRRVEAASAAAEDSARLTAEKERWDGYAAQLAARAEQRRQSLLLLVNPWNPVPEDYTLRLREAEYGYNTDARCTVALQTMLSDCRAAGYRPVLCSAYRTAEYQQMLYDNKLMRVLSTGMYTPEQAEKEAAASVAPTGTSEHQLGLAVDIIDENYPELDYWQQYTGTQIWLMDNSWRYGFILRYPVDSSEITGIIFEPWHYRYVGRAIAEEIYAQGITLEEYIEK